MTPDSILDGNDGSKVVSTQTDGHNLIEMINRLNKDTQENATPLQQNTLSIQNGPENIFMMNQPGISMKTSGNIFSEAVDRFENTLGDQQSVIGKDFHNLVLGDSTNQYGSATEKQITAAKNLQKATTEIDQKKMDTIKNTKGEQVPCPVCSQEVLTDRGYCLLDDVIAIIRFALPNFPYPLDVIQQILDFLGIKFQSPEEVKSLNGGEGCGSPGCKNGMVYSPQQPIQKANEQAVQELKSRQKELAQYQQDMGSGGTAAIGPFTGDTAIHVGPQEAINNSPTVALKEENTTVFGFTNKTTPDGVGFIPMTKGNCKKAVHSDPLINPGSLFLGVTQKFTMTTGSPGIDIHTTGKASLNAAVTDIVATDGELMLRSGNVTTVKGANVIIDANDGAGNSGCRIDSKNTMVAGALHVQGDLAVKGHISMDGGLTVTHITAPGERVATGPSGSAHQVHSSACWNNPEMGEMASIYDAFDKIWKTGSRDLFNVLSQNIAQKGMSEIKTLVEEVYHSALLLSTVDNFAMPTGFATAWFAPPGAPAGIPLIVQGVALDSLNKPITFVDTFVVPGQTLPVYNFTHNHNSPGANHSHDYTQIQAHYTGNSMKARSIRPEPSNVPSPAKDTGTGTKPGHKSMGGFCLPCINPFGGGNAKRNGAYGLGPENDYNGTNYVQIDGKFDELGNLVPPPSIDLNC